MGDYIEIKKDDTISVIFFVLNRSAYQHFFNFTNRLSWIELFRADIHAVHDRMATE